jgi:flagellar biosynthesis/type III secretory pathway chaperone
MIAAETPRTPTRPLTEDDERSLLVRLELLLEREEEMIVARDAAGLVAVAEERERVTAQLGAAASARRLASVVHGDEAELIELYTRLRQRHQVRARLIQRHAERNGRAVSVMAQATGQTQFYEADGRVPLKFVAI